jgi:hypothetical protein
VRVSFALCILMNICCFYFVDHNHSDSDEMESQCSFDFDFL